MSPLDAIRANRDQTAELRAKLQQHVKDAFAAGYTWQEIADALGVKSKQRVYQIRDGK